MTARYLAITLCFIACDDDASTPGTTDAATTTSSDTSVTEPDDTTTPDDTSVTEPDDTTTPDDSTVASDTTSDTGAETDSSEPTPIPDPASAYIGAFQLEVYPAMPEVEQPGWNQFDVYLYDGPLPAYHEVVKTIGHCTRYNRKVAQCDPECDSSHTCDANGACVPLRNQLFVGNTTWTRESGGAPVSVDPVTSEDGYTYYESTVVDGDPWAANGEDVTFVAEGSAGLAGFATEVHGIAPMTAMKTGAKPFEVATEFPEDLDFVWEPASPGATVELALRTGHHVAPPATMVHCSAPDSDGHVLVAKELLVGMGFCTGICLFPHPSDITRVDRSVVETDKGPVEVVIKTRGVLQVRD